MPAHEIASCHVPTLNDVEPVRAAFGALCADIAPYGWAVAYERPMECSGLLHYELRPGRARGRRRAARDRHARRAARER